MKLLLNCLDFDLDDGKVRPASRKRVLAICLPSTTQSKNLSRTVDGIIEASAPRDGPGPGRAAFHLLEHRSRQADHCPEAALELGADLRSERGCSAVFQAFGRARSDRLHHQADDGARRARCAPAAR